MLAKIGLKDVRLHGPHGYFDEEHRMGNEFSIDVTVAASIGEAAGEDDLSQTVNYATIYYLLKAEMKRPTQLLEALAYRMAARIVDQFDNVRSVELRLHKLNPPLGGRVGSSFVEVNLKAEDSAARDSMADFQGAHTFEDDLALHYDADGPFASPNAQPSAKIPRAPRPIRPVDLPAPEPLPPPGWAEMNGKSDAEAYANRVLDNENEAEEFGNWSIDPFTPEAHAVTDEGLSPPPNGDDYYELGEDWDTGDELNADFDALGFPHLKDDED